MSKYKYTYITKKNRLTYIGLNDLLDPSCNDIGESYLDFLAGKWVLLSEEQVLFKEESTALTCRNDALVDDASTIESERRCGTVSANQR